MTKKAKTKGAAHRAWLDDLQSRPREEAVRLVAERYPQLSEQEVQRRLSLLDDSPPPITGEPHPPKRVRKARAALSRAMARARNMFANQQDDLSRELLAKVEEGRFDGLR